jgi:hypothetical protein
MRRCAHKIRKTLTGRKNGPPSEETKARISVKLMGHSVDPKSTARAVEKRKGYKHSKNIKKIIGNHSRTRIRTEATREKQRAAAIEQWRKRKAESSQS